jgi:arabinofuranosyltransferase
MGLNDYVVARNPELRLPIQMAHERKPPPGYVECFSPNIAFTPKHAAIRPRAEELTAEKIVQCEQEYAVRIASGATPTPSPSPSPTAP